MSLDLTNKKILITGGTGSFGSTFLNKIYSNKTFSEIRVFSRDEKKQDDLRNKINTLNVKFYIGDVRDLDSVYNAVKGVDYVFHAAALKQVPSCEFFPLEAVKTNIIGTDNVLKACENFKVKKAVILSTDKAAYPINAMGMSKALMEKVMIARSRNMESSSTTFCGTRYGNVMASRGSVIPLFIKQIKNNEDLTITNPSMTRFMMSLDDAVNLVEYAFNNGNNGEMFIHKAPAATIEVLAKALLELYNSTSKIKNIGTRHGEKLYETLITHEEMINSVDLGDYFKINPDSRDLNYHKFYSKGKIVSDNIVDYNSSNTHLLSISEMKDLLLKLPSIANDLKSN